MQPADRPAPGLLVVLNYAFLMAGVAVIAAILTAAAFMQYAHGELPCPLCLLQRAAMLGVCFGMLQNLRREFSGHNTGISLVFAVLLLIIAARQTLLDIYPRPGHEYVGSAVLGLHMPVWSVLIALVLISALALRLAILGGDSHMRGARLADYPAAARLADGLALYVIALAAVNLVSVILQCGLGQCHTFGYVLLGGPDAPPSGQ